MSSMWPSWWWATPSGECRSLEADRPRPLTTLSNGSLLSRCRATTHSDLVLRAVHAGIPYRVVHNASVLNAVGCCGLQVPGGRGQRLGVLSGAGLSTVGCDPSADGAVERELVRQRAVAAANRVAGPRCPQAAH